MTQPDPIPSTLGWQQLIAAYADGELDDAARESVRNWIDEHPEAYSHLLEQRSLSPGNTPFWDEVRIPEPTAAAWAGVWNRLEASLEPPAPRARPHSRSPWWRRGLIAAMVALPCTAAAAAVIAVCLPDQPGPVAVAPVDESPSDEVFQVATAQDVQILRIRDADVPQLVVGEPPLNDAMVFAVAGDVRLEDLQPANDGMIPEVKMGANDVPLIYSPTPRTP